ncbi:MAG: GtrA family protein [Kiritimatiellaeota bacterium]|nr:GtrA family protein [Kiritimatiellota bacterium]
MKQILHQFAGRKAHPVIQFIKYGISGGIVTIFSMAVFAILTWKVFPSLQENELIVRLLKLHVEPIDEIVRARNYAYCQIIVFMLANLVCYFINIAWVFEPGRHSRRKELFLFYVVSLISFVAGTALGTGLIAFFNAGAVTAYVANMIAAVLINFAGRKYYIFKQ